MTAYNWPATLGDLMTEDEVGFDAASQRALGYNDIVVADAAGAHAH